MKITALEVDGFGIWNGLKLDEVADGLSVVYGPNEAGKTTLVQFVRSVFYGFSPERRCYFPPAGGGHPGGSACVAGPNGQFRISRHLNRNQQDGPDELTLRAADGSRQGEHLLKVLLSNLDEPTFQNVFAVGLREIQHLSTLSDTKAAALLYSISAGMDRVALVEVMRALEQSRNRLLDAGGDTCRIVQLMAERDKLAAALEQSRTAIRRYGRLAAERDQFDREAARLEEENRQLQHDHEVVEIALALRERWRQREALDQQLAVLAPMETVPEGALERLDAIHARLEDRQQRAEQLKQQQAKLRAEATGLKVNDTLLRMAPRIEAIQEQSDWIGTLEDRLLELEIETADLEGQLKSERERFGLGKDGNPQAFPSVSARSLSALRQPAAALRRCRQRLEEAQREVGKGQETARSIQEQIRATLVERGEPDLPTAVERASALASLLRRRVQVDERLEQMDLYQSELEEQSRGLLDGQLLPAKALLVLGVLFIAGPMLLLLKVFGLLVSTALTDPLSWMHVGLGVLCTFAAFVGKSILERVNAKRLGACHQQIHMLQTQIKQAKEERESLDKQLPRGDGPVTVRLQAAERELSALEELVPLDARRQAAEQDADSATERVRTAETELAAVRRRWREAIALLGLPEGLSPKQVRQLAASCGRVQEMDQRLGRLREETQQRRRELDALCGRIRKMVSEAEIAVHSSQPAEQLQELVERLADHEARLKQRDLLRADARRLRRKEAKYGSTIRRLKSQRKKLLRAVKVEDERDLRRKAAELRRVAELRRERDQLQREIEAAIGSRCAEDEVLRQLGRDPFENLESRAEQLEHKRRANEAHLHARFEKRGQVAEQLKSLAEDRGPALRQLELATIEKRLEDAVRRWQTLAVTSRALLTVRKIYEKDRQPETLREASGYLQRMTHGRYMRVWAPLGEDSLLVEESPGSSRPLELLSRGTREQLFLSLRLALASCYARRGVQMPMILDDVLVNFDSRRAKAATEVLRDFAETGHQVLVFTCHDHVVKLFQSLSVPVTALPEQEGPAAVISSPPAAPKKKRKPKRSKKPPREPVSRSGRHKASKRQAEPEWMPVEELAAWEEFDEAPVTRVPEKRSETGGTGGAGESGAEGGDDEGDQGERLDEDDIDGPSGEIPEDVEGEFSGDEYDEDGYDDFNDRRGAEAA